MYTEDGIFKFVSDLETRGIECWVHLLVKSVHKFDMKIKYTVKSEIKTGEASNWTEMSRKFKDEVTLLSEKGHPVAILKNRNLIYIAGFFCGSEWWWYYGLYTYS